MTFLMVNNLIIWIVLLGACLRFAFFDLVPPSLNWDEVSLGYNSYSVLKTGKDEWGRSFPLTFEAFGDFKLPGYIYVDVPFIWLIGLNEFAVRLPSLLAGVLSILLVYLIVKEAFGDKKWALLSGLFIAISPWAFFLSRIALEANLAFFLFLLGLYCFLKGLRKTWFLSVSSLFFGSALFTYNSARIFLPLFLLSLVFIYRKEILALKKKIILPFILIVMFFIGAFFLAVSQDSSSRYFWVTILDQGAINYLDESRNNTQLPVLISKLVYNRYVYFIENFISNYLSHFSMEFLFLKGGSNYQFSIPNVGIMYLFELPLFLYGAFKIIQKKNFGLLILAWFFIAPIPAAITRESPHVLRSIFMLGALQVITALGLLEAYVRIQKVKLLVKIFTPAFLSLSVFSIIVYLYQYFVIYPARYSQSWQFSYKQLIDYMKPSIDSGQKIYFSKRYGEPHIFYLFFTRYDPAKYQENPTLVRYSMTSWRWVDRLDNINFVNDWEVKEKMKDIHDVILITSGGNYPKGAQVIKSFYFLDGSKSFDVVKL